MKTTLIDQMIRKTIPLIASVAALCISAEVANAKITSLESSVSFDIQHTTALTWQKRSKFRHSADCYPGGKSDKLDAAFPETIQSKSVAAGVRQVSAAVNSAHYGSIGSMLAEAVTEPRSEPGQFAVSIRFADQISRNSYRNIGDSNCVIREYHWSVSAVQLNGMFTYSFKMPPNTWLVAVSFEDVAANLPANIVGDLHGAKLEKSMFIWARPGSQVSIPIKVNTQSSGGTVSSFKLNIDTLQTSDTRLAIERWKEIRENFLMVQGRLKSVEMDKVLRNLLRAGAEVLADDSVSIEISKSTGAQSNRQLVDWLFQIANSSDQFSAAYDNHVKAMSAAVGYKLALALLTDMSEFCKEIDIYLPMSNRTVRTSGFVAAGYFMNRDIRRIEEIRFPEIRAYVDGLIKFETSGRLYSDIAKEDANYDKVKSGYQKILRSSEIAFDVYGDIQRGLDRTLAVFKTNSASLLLNEQIRTELSHLSQAQSAFRKSFREEFGKFNMKNQTRIESSKLIAELDSLEARSQDLSEKLLSQIKLVSLTPEDTNSTIVGIMTSLLAHQVGIFDAPLKSSFAEPLRTAFAKSDEANQLRATYQQCLGGAQ